MILPIEPEVQQKIRLLGTTLNQMLQCYPFDGTPGKPDPRSGMLKYRQAKTLYNEIAGDLGFSIEVARKPGLFFPALVAYCDKAGSGEVTQDIRSKLSCLASSFAMAAIMDTEDQGQVAARPVKLAQPQPL